MIMISIIAVGILMITITITLSLSLQFELISADVKSNPFDPNPEAGRSVKKSQEETATQLNWTKKCSALLKILDEPPEDSGVKFPDLVEEATLLDWAGVNIGRAEVYRLYLAIKQLAESLPAEVGKLRLFGQIHTTGSSPYIIVEGLSPEDEEGIDELLQEGKSGANKFAYWVARSTTPSPEEWVKLPNVTMAQIVAARKFKKLLTGNLDNVVSSYPPFPGTERALLRLVWGYD
jgi:radial spoke head protein 4A